MKTNIFIFAFNRPDILPSQIKSIRKNFIGEYDINVIHDSRNNEFCDIFKSTCKKLNIKFYHRNSYSGKNPSQYHADSINWAYINFINKKLSGEIALILDHDMFLIDELNLSNIMEEFDIIGCEQNKKHIRYIWPGLFAFKVNSLDGLEFNFNPGSIANNILLDTGGGTYKLLENKNLRFFDTGVEYPDYYNDIYLDDNDITNGYGYELHFGGKFLHFRNACNWHRQFKVNDDKKTEVLFKIISNIL